METPGFHKELGRIVVDALSHRLKIHQPELGNENPCTHLEGFLSKDGLSGSDLIRGVGRQVSSLSLIVLETSPADGSGRGRSALIFY